MILFTLEHLLTIISLYGFGIALILIQAYLLSKPMRRILIHSWATGEYVDGIWVVNNYEEVLVP